MKGVLLAFVLAVGGGNATHAKKVVYGTVTLDGKPTHHVLVSIGSWGTTTDKSGRYHLVVDTDRQLFVRFEDEAHHRLRWKGHHEPTVTFAAESSGKRDFDLEPE